MGRNFRRMDIPEPGDVEGLTRLYEESVQRILAADYEPAERAAWLALLEQHYLDAIRPYLPRH